MKQVIRNLVFATVTGLMLAVVAGRPAEANNFYYFSEKKPNFSSSQLTDHYKTSVFSPKIEIGKISHLFPETVRHVYWIGKTDLQTKPYELYAIWFGPDGTERQHERCRWGGTSEYRSEMKFPKKKGAELLGQWVLQIQDATGDIMLRERFYVGPAMNILMPDPASRWDNAAYDIKDADAVVLLNDVRYKVHGEHGITKTVYKKIKILTEAGKAFNEFYEPYKERQFPRIKFAHTVKPDGSINSDAQQFAGVLQRVPPHYRSARVMFVRMLQAEPGDIVEYEMIFEEPFLPAEDLVYDEFFISEGMPVLEARYTVTVPDSMDLQYNMLNTAAEPTVTRIPAAAQNQLTWERRNIPPVAGEPAMPDYRRLGESVIISSAREWVQVADWWQAHTRKKLQLTDAIEEVVRDIRNRQRTSADALLPIVSGVAERPVIAGIIIDDEFGWSRPDKGIPLVEPAKIAAWITRLPVFEASLQPVGVWLRAADRQEVATEMYRDLTTALRDTGDQLREFLRDIYDFVRYDTDPVGFDFAWADPEPVPAETTLEKKNGDAKNRVVLLRTLLRAAGFESQTVLLRTAEHGRLAPGVCGLGEFNHVVAITRIGGDEYVLDPLARYYRGWTLPTRTYGAEGVVVGGGEVRSVTVPAQDPSEGHTQVNISLTMNKEFNVSGKLRIEYFGRMDAEMKNEFNSWDQNGIAAFLRRQLSDYIPGGNFDKANLFNQEKRTRNARIQLGLQVTTPWITGEAPWIVVLIGPDAFFPDYVRKGRVHGVHLSGLRDVRVTSRVKLPESIAVGDLPEDVLVETEYLSYAARFRKDDQGSLVLEARFAEKKTDIGKDEYAAFLADYEKMARALGAGIPLIPAPPKPPEPVTDGR